MTLPYVPSIQPDPPLAESMTATFEDRDRKVLGEMPREET
jgi:hypothetical protein